MEHYDMIVLGGGPGGYAAAIAAGKRGKNTLLIEEREVGGACLNRGCIPTKALLHSAQLYREMRRCAPLGLAADRVRYDYGGMAARKDTVVRRLGSGVTALLRAAGVQTVHARGVLTGPGRVAAGEGLYEAPDIILATGSAPSLPPIPGADLPGVVTSDGALAMTKAPESVVIVGGGVIGLEFADLFSMLEIPVTVLEALPEVLAGMEREVVAPVLDALAARGVNIVTGARVRDIIRAGELCTRYSSDGKDAAASSGLVLLAAGRRPATAGIGLERAGVAVDAGGYVRVDDTLATNIPGIWAIGDITGRQQLAHVATAQAMAAVENICGGRRIMRYSAVPACVYTTPEIASVGLTQRQAEGRGRRVRVGSFPVAANGRSLILDGAGVARLVTDEDTGELLGAHICAPGATEIIVGIALAMNAEATVDELGGTIFPHPTVSEIVMEAAHDVAAHSVHKP